MNLSFRVLRKWGGKVVLIGRNEEVGNQRVRQLKESGSEALFVKADVLSKQDLLDANELVMDKWGAD